MKYQTQKVAYPFFIAALALFAAQVIFGVVAGAIYFWPNLLIVWLLIGFFGATYYLLPEEAETEIHSPTLA